MAHHRIWKFRPPEGREDEFAAVYGADGEWARLFRKVPGYETTILLRPTEPKGWWLTIDRWDSEASFADFTQNFGEQYRSLDAKLEGVAGEEQFVGAFEG